MTPQSDPCTVHRTRHHGRELTNVWRIGYGATDVPWPITPIKQHLSKGRPAAASEQLRGDPLRTQFGRALSELGIEWIAAHSPQAKGRIERLFETLQDRLVKELRLAGIDSIEGANHFLEMRFVPEWEQRFNRSTAECTQCPSTTGARTALEEILSVRVARRVAQDHNRQLGRKSLGSTAGRSLCGASWSCGRDRTAVGRKPLAALPSRYLHLRACPEPCGRPQVLPAYGLQDLRNKHQTQNKSNPNTMYLANHPWRKPWKRTFLSGENPDISTLR